MWQIKKSKHYQFNYLPQTLAESDIDKIIKIQENGYKKIVDFLKLKNDKIINYYLYPTNLIKGELTGDDGNGNAFLDSFKVHSVYNKDVKCIGSHEDVHLLAQKIGLPILLFREGLAESFEKFWNGKQNNFWINKYSEENSIPEIIDLFDYDKWDRIDSMISYPVAKSFVAFLINKYGKSKFLELYKILDIKNDIGRNTELFKLVLDIDLKVCEGFWLNKIKEQSANI